MIRKIGVIYQDANSLGFLCGLRDRLTCEAEFIPPPSRIGTTRDLRASSARLAWRSFKAQGADLVVRFTDSDQGSWQDVRRGGIRVVPPEGRSQWLCGVAVSNVEEWLCLDVDYIANALEIPRSELEDPASRTGRVKRALRQARRGDEDASEVAARLVREAPRAVFRRWLEDKSLRRFYSDCRTAAARDNCDTPNELDQAVDEDE